MEGYLEIFGRKFCGKKGNFGLWRRKFFWGVETLSVLLGKALAHALEYIVWVET
jgi:hypothetical protein